MSSTCTYWQMLLFSSVRVGFICSSCHFALWIGEKRIVNLRNIRLMEKEICVRKAVYCDMFSVGLNVATNIKL